MGNDMTVTSVGDGYETSSSSSYDDGTGGQSDSAGFDQGQNQGIGNGGNGFGNSGDPNQALQAFQGEGGNQPTDGNPVMPDGGADPTGQECSNGPPPPDTQGAGNSEGGASSIEDMKAKALAQILGISEEEVKEMLANKQEEVPATQDQNAMFA